jgi:transposase
MLWWLKTGQITQHKTLAERLGRDGSTVTRWLQKYRQRDLSTEPDIPHSLSLGPLPTMELN